MQQKSWGVRMTEEDHKFYENQKKCPPVGYCQAYVDRKWKVTNDRNEMRKQRSRNENFNFECVQESNDGTQEQEDKNDANFVQSTEVKYQYVCVEEDADDEIPIKYRHVRNGARSVSPELYELMHVLQSQFHVSKNQVEGSIINVANYLFGRKWKCHLDNTATDSNTLPAMSSLRRTEPFMEAMALSSIVEEIMEEGNAATVVYSNDGSAVRRLGSYVVSSLTINGIQRALPTFSIFTESRDSLKNLQIRTYEILSAACCHKYTNTRQSVMDYD